MRTPDLDRGPIRAWKITARGNIDQEATLESWLVQGPFHPAWSFWTISVITLKDMPGVKPAHKNYDDAEYELMIISIESPPASRNRPDPDVVDSLKFLLPPDVKVQFDGITEDQARKVCQAVVRAVLDGHSPDQDYRNWWVGSIYNTVKHFKEGKHG